MSAPFTRSAEPMRSILVILLLLVIASANVAVASHWHVDDGAVTADDAGGAASVDHDCHSLAYFVTVPALADDTALEPARTTVPTLSQTCATRSLSPPVPPPLHRA